jgi:fatty acid desaturase
MSRCLARSNLRAASMFAANWLIIAGAFGLFAIWPNPLTFILGALILGGRQLGLAVLYHDCSHSVMFTNRRLNDFLGHWLAGGPLNTSLFAYRAYHLKHHQFAGTEDDPDLALALTYPASKDSMKRKIWRDITGQTGVKDVRRQFRKFGIKRNVPFVATHLVMFGVLAAAGVGWAYCLWWAAYLTAYQVITRLRFMGEHGVATDRLSLDPRENTCTTQVKWWERMFIAPNYVNYHLEHHLTAAVPCYNLAHFHQLLSQRGFFDDKPCLSNGYVEVLRRATRPEAPLSAAA